MDPNGNGYISLAEIDKGINDMGAAMAVIYENKDVMLRAFNAAKGKSKSKKEVDGDFVQRAEFRFFLMYLRQYLEYKVMFDEVDTSGDGKVGLNEFKKAIPTIEKWGVTIKDAEAEFKKIDADGGGSIFFNEFSHYCIQQSLDLEDDGADNELTEAVKELKQDGWDPKKVEKYGHFKPLSQGEEEKHLKFMNGIKLDQVDWKKIAEWLPCHKNDKDARRREEIFKFFDPNNNGYLSLAEIDGGFQKVGKQIEVIYLSKPPMLRAFNAAKGHYKDKKKNSPGQDYVQRSEFRIFLLYMRQYFEYFVMFKKMDKSGDGKVNFEEFKKAVPQINKWGGNITDPKAVFNKIDVNGGGSILFEEFAHFSIAQKLDLEDDGDDKEFEEAAKNLLKDADDPSKPKKYRHY